MSRKRPTNETLESVNRVASAREYARLAESILGPAATDREVLETAQRLSSMSLGQVRGINNRRQAIQKQTRRLAAVDGAEDPWGEAGPEQPDPTNNQAYTKQIMTSTDNSVVESLQKKDIHTPTASRSSKLSRQSRQKWGAKENDEDDEREEDDESDVEAAEGGPMDDEPGHEVDQEGMEEDEEGDFDDLDLEDHDVESEFDDHLEDLGHDEEGGEDEEHFEDMEGAGDEMGMDDEEGDDFEDLMGEDEMEDEDHEIFEDESEDMEDLGDEEFEEGEDLGEGEDGLEGFDEDESEALEHEHEHALPMPPKGSRQNRASARRQASTKNTKGGQKSKKKVASGAGNTKVSLDDILNLHDEDVAREASSTLEGDDLEALLGRKVQSAGNRVQTQVRATGNALESHRAMFERVWDNENDAGVAPRRRQASRRKSAVQQQRKPVSQQQRKIARSSQDFSEDERSFTRTQFSPDRRRVASRPNDNEFDQVFKVPDVSRFFD